MRFNVIVPPEAVQMYRDGMSYYDVGQVFGISEPVIRNAVLAAGVKPRKPGKPRRVNYRRILRLLKTRTVRQVAKKLNTTYDTIYYVKRQYANPKP